VPHSLPISPAAEFDRPVFDRLIDDIGRDTAFQALALLLAETGPQLRRMDEMLAEEDRTRLKREAHSLKSAAATLGFLSLSVAAKEVEIAAEGVAAGELRALLTVLGHKFLAAGRVAPRPPPEKDLEVGS
jgi:HPt (histidine-containing phosphotransfer) domain-containing protein